MISFFVYGNFTYPLSFDPENLLHFLKIVMPASLKQMKNQSRIFAEYES